MIARKGLDRLLKQSNSPSISIIIGARQVGKSTLMGMIRERLSGQSEVFNLENPLHLAVFNEGYTSFIRNVRTKIVFIDEFQYCKGISSIFKAVHDLNPDVKLYATGSSSLEIQRHLKESLAGRKIETVLYPLSYGEWLQGVSEKIEVYSRTDLDEITTIEEMETHRRQIDAFLRYGALPGVPSTDDLEKREYLFGIYQTYIAKDIKSYLKDESVLSFNKAITWLALNNGVQLKKATLAAVTGISTRQIDRYIDVLAGTFVLALLPPLSSNKGKELSKTPKFYLYDQGIINSIIQDFRPVDGRPDAGMLREQYVFWELKKHMDVRFSLNYWRTADGKEVDFILTKDREMLPIEVKSGWKPPAIPQGLKQFLSIYPETKNAIVLYDGPESTIFQGSLKVRFLPIHRAWAIPSAMAAWS